eukprot:scaffold271720_cov13-Tisochrysis_lutea.AAC.1
MRNIGCMRANQGVLCRMANIFHLTKHSLVCTHSPEISHQTGHTFFLQCNVLVLAAVLTISLLATDAGVLRVAGPRQLAGVPCVYGGGSHFGGGASGLGGTKALGKGSAPAALSALRDSVQ